MNEFDTKFIAPEEIKLTDNRDNTSPLRLEANIDVVDKKTTHTKELETTKQKKARRKYFDHVKTQDFATFLREWSS